MGSKEEASNKAQDIKGKVKEKAGKAVGNKDLESEGQADQAESALKDVRDKAKEVPSKVKKAATDE